MICSVCKQHGKLYNHFDSDVCEDCEAKAEAAYAERVDYDYWHRDDASESKERSGG